MGQSHFTSSPSLNNAADYKGGGVASPHGVLDIWRGMDPPDPGMDIPEGVHNYIKDNESTESTHFWESPCQSTRMKTAS